MRPVLRGPGHRRDREHHRVHPVRRGLRVHPSDRGRLRHQGHQGHRRRRPATSASSLGWGGAYQDDPALSWDGWEHRRDPLAGRCGPLGLGGPFGPGGPGGPFGHRAPGPGVPERAVGPCPESRRRDCYRDAARQGGHLVAVLRSVYRCLWLSPLALHRRLCRLRVPPEPPEPLAQAGARAQGPPSDLASDRASAPLALPARQWLALRSQEPR